mmetsp:Transcript_40226/g.159826  ORF Transcript_40226/g.159826 Transcript_40226/m.159826 type:complete len:254 (-) Transcript_40226:319-1080(-)
MPMIAISMVQSVNGSLVKNGVITLARMIPRNAKFSADFSHFAGFLARSAGIVKSQISQNPRTRAPSGTSGTKGTCPLAMIPPIAAEPHPWTRKTFLSQSCMTIRFSLMRVALSFSLSSSVSESASSSSLASKSRTFAGFINTSRGTPSSFTRCSTFALRALKSTGPSRPSPTELPSCTGVFPTFTFSPSALPAFRRIFTARTPLLLTTPPLATNAMAARLSIWWNSASLLQQTSHFTLISKLDNSYRKQSRRA